MTLFKASLPQDDGFLLRKERKLALAADRLIYDYAYGVDDLDMPLAKAAGPIAQLATIPRWVAGQAKNAAAISKNTRGVKHNGVESVDSIADYARLFATYPVSSVANNWTTDRCFADQRSAGLNPMKLALVANDAASKGKHQPLWATLSGKLSPQVTADSALHAALGPNATWAAAVANKQVFVIDYAILKTIVADPNAPGEDGGKRVLAPICLFVRVPGEDGLTPVAIQLGQTPNDPVHLPSDTPAWLMAKTFVQTADVNDNQLINHLGLVHLVQDSFALGMFRQLDNRHPVRRMMEKHFTAVLVINFAGELVLVGSKGIVAKILEAGADGSTDLINEAYNAWSFYDLDVVQNIADRGLSDPSVLPYYPYRDDGKRVWDVLGAYITEYLEFYYGKAGTQGAQDKLAGDYELQAWFNEISADGTGDDGGKGRVKGIPAQITDLPQLSRILHLMVWTASAQHAAVNFPQVEFTNFVPNQPTADYSAPIAGPVSTADILRMMPPLETAQEQFDISYQLAGYHYDQLLDYADDMDKDVQDIVRKAHAELSGPVTTAINQANVRRDQEGRLTYVWLLPANIPNSTSV